MSISYPFAASLTASHGLLDIGDVWKFDAETVTKELKEDLKGDDELEEVEEDEEKEPNSGKEEEMDGLLNEVWNVATALNREVDDEELVGDSRDSPSGDATVEDVDVGQDPDVKVVMVPTEASRAPPVAMSVQDDVGSGNLEDVKNIFTN